VERFTYYVHDHQISHARHVDAVWENNTQRVSECFSLVGSVDCAKEANTVITYTKLGHNTSDRLSHSYVISVLTENIVSAKYDLFAPDSVSSIFANETFKTNLP